MNNISNLLGDYNLFLYSIFENLTIDNIDVSKFELDHICYRVSSEENYLFIKSKISEYGEILAENIISGRKIATYKLYNPIIYKNRKISVLELPSPKEGSIYLDGFEHIEFVINDSFVNFINKYSNIDFITKDLDKINNPDIKIIYSSGSVKFHRDTLENVIMNEK